MNDELSGQLASHWRVPVYARGLLWIETETDLVRVESERGAFALSAPASILTLRWGGGKGPALAQLRWQPDSLEWDGSACIGGYVDALHITEQLDLPDPVTILHVGGQPLKPGTAPFPSAAQRSQAPFAVPSFFDGIAQGVPESVTTWVALTDSPALVLAQDALVSKMSVYCFGHLADDDAGWHEAFALPLALEAMTLFAP